MNNCLFCGTSTKNKKFCSRSCSAKLNNKKFPKRKSKRSLICPQCNNKKDPRSSFCKNCTPRNGLGDLTLKEAIYEKHHKSSAYALVRSRARAIAKELGLDKCQVCGYNKHVEIAHKKAISTFKDSTLVSTINSKDNLIALCPNCHWEYDHNL